MPFEEVLKVLKTGGCVAVREVWDGKAIWYNEHTKEIELEDDISITYWTPNQEDILAEDWELL